MSIMKMSSTTPSSLSPSLTGGGSRPAKPGSAAASRPETARFESHPQYRRLTPL